MFGDRIERVAAEARERFSSYIRDVVEPGVLERDRDGKALGPEILRGAADAGLTRFAMPREVNGEGRDLFDWGIVLEEIGYLCSDGAFPMVLSAALSTVEELVASKRPELVERYALPIARGEAIGGFAYTEGSDPFHFKTIAKRDGSSWVLSGRKSFVTAGTYANPIKVYVRDEASDDLLAFLVERGDPGVTLEPVQAIGLRSGGYAILTLNDVRLDEDRLFVKSDGLGHVQAYLNRRRPILVCGALGTVRAMLERAVDLIAPKVRYGRGVLEYPNVQAAIGKTYAALETSRTMVYRALARFADGSADPMWDPYGTIAKYTATETALDAAQRLMRVLGTEGFLEATHWDRYLRDFSGMIIGAGPQDLTEMDLGVRFAAELETRRMRERAKQRRRK